MNELFGTDGLRGKAGRYPLDPRTIFSLGASLAGRLTERSGHSPRVMVGRDTRASGPEIEGYITAGIQASGGSVESAGIVPTPAVAFLAGRFRFDCGVVISASHNSYEDNGIKIFSPDGKKIDDQTEDLIAADIRDQVYAPSSIRPEPASFDPKFADSYLHRLVDEIGAGLDLRRVRVVVDCANGAASAMGPAVLRELGASVEAIHSEPDGFNINRDCGAVHLAELISRVTSGSFGLGAAFDGDADRLLLVGAHGDVFDGDHILYSAATVLKTQGRLRQDRVVGTVMSNAGLEWALSRRSIELLRTPVGDRFVLERLLETHSSLGGEQSGHVIFPDISLAGDGIITLLVVLRILTESGEDLYALTREMKKFPQVLINVPVRKKPPFESIPMIDRQRKVVEEHLSGRGRLLLRYSGTEDLARVMIEGEDQTEIEVLAKSLGETIASALA